MSSLSKNEQIMRIRPVVEQTFSPAVLTPLGGFAALYELKSLTRSYRDPLLVQSVDGVGTKIMVAHMMNRYDTIGIDLVSATSNDILVYGAKPLTLLDYIASDRLDPGKIEAIITSIAKACCLHNITLVGGETAQMPGMYLQGEHDLVGFITGVVEKEKAILGENIVPGDVVLGFASNGLHTNGYSLARKLLFEQKTWHVASQLPELDKPLGETLLEPHLNYAHPVLSFLEQNLPIKGMAHITGGGIVENIPRILPLGCSVEIRKKSWPEQAIFSILQRLGQLDEMELYRTFNMGIGFVLIGDATLSERARSAMHAFPEFKLYEIGQVLPGERQVKLCE